MKKQEFPLFLGRSVWFIFKKTGEQEFQSNSFLIQGGCVKYFSVKGKFYCTKLQQTFPKIHSLNFTIFFLANFLPIKFLSKGPEKEVVQLSWKVYISANSKVAYSKNEFSLQGMQIRHFLINEHVQIF